MLRSKLSKNGLPYLYYSFEITEENIKSIQQNALATQRVAHFTLERLTISDEIPVQTTPIFRIHFGHFGFKIQDIAPKTKNNPSKNWILPEEWSPKGRVIDDASFFKGWEKFFDSWVINELHFQPMGTHQYREVPKPKIPHRDTCYHHKCTQLLVLSSRFGDREVLPYHQENGRQYVARWFRISTDTKWQLEWFALPKITIQLDSIHLTSPKNFAAVYPLKDSNILVSEFLTGSELYLPSNYVPCLSQPQKRRQLLDALWWMETRFRVLPRYPYQRLEQCIHTLTLEGDLFFFPSSLGLPPMTTTDILRSYSQRGNPLIRWMTTRRPATKPD